MKTAITTTVIVLALLLLAKGKLFNLSPGKSTQPTTEKVEVVEKTETPTPEPSPVNGWTKIMVDDGFTWFQPIDPSKTTEWFDISRWNILDRLKKPAVMEFKTSSGELIAFRLDKTGKYLKKPDGSFSSEKWSEKEYQEVFHRSTGIRYHPLPPESTLDLQVARRSY